MSYKLYTDRNENFECDVAIKNATLKGSIARLIVESDNLCLVFNGKINNNKCVVPIHRLKGLLEEYDRGKMQLEIIVEDTYFRPWESDFIVEEHTSVKVKVQDQKQSSNKPIVEIKTQPVSKIFNERSKSLFHSNDKIKDPNLFTPLSEIAIICSKFGVTKSNVSSRKRDLTQILKEYFSSNPEYKNHQFEIVKKAITFLK